MTGLYAVNANTTKTMESKGKTMSEAPIEETEEYEFVDETEEIHFKYLDNLRSSGVTNMFGGGQYLTDEFDIGLRDAFKILSKWMKTFEQRGCPEGEDWSEF